MLDEAVKTRQVGSLVPANAEVAFVQSSYQRKKLFSFPAA
jgi:hypothetical protein